MKFSPAGFLNWFRFLTRKPLELVITNQNAKGFTELFAGSGISKLDIFRAVSYVLKDEAVFF
jgi:hypothetical protein